MKVAKEYGKPGSVCLHGQQNIVPCKASIGEDEGRIPIKNGYCSGYTSAFCKHENTQRIRYQIHQKYIKNPSKRDMVEVIGILIYATAVNHVLKVSVVS